VLASDMGALSYAFLVRYLSTTTYASADRRPAPPPPSYFPYVMVLLSYMLTSILWRPPTKVVDVHTAAI